MKESREKAYEKAMELSASHYENFPVVSLFVPAHLRRHIAIVYRFARQADDLADEGTIPDEERLELLNRYEDELSKAFEGKNEDPFWQALEYTVKERRLSPEYFYALLYAFKQDIVKKRYNSFEEIRDYCRNSADPVGRLILELYDLRSEKYNLLSDKICTALQLANFYQDVSLDILKNRIYVPLDEMERFGVHEADFLLKKNSSNFKLLIKHQTDRAGLLFSEGAELLKYLQGRFKYEIKWTVLGGEKILEKIRKIDYNVLEIRPALKKTDFFTLMLKSLI